MFQNIIHSLLLLVLALRAAFPVRELFWKNKVAKKTYEKLITCTFNGYYIAKK